MIYLNVEIIVIFETNCNKIIFKKLCILRIFWVPNTLVLERVPSSEIEGTQDVFINFKKNISEVKRKISQTAGEGRPGSKRVNGYGKRAYDGEFKRSPSRVRGRLVHSLVRESGRLPAWVFWQTEPCHRRVTAVLGTGRAGRTAVDDAQHVPGLGHDIDAK